MSEETINVPKAEWERLQKLEADLPALLEKTKQERDKERLKELSQRNKENPEEHRRKAKEYYTLKKDIIKAKRREAYARKKAETPAIPDVSSEGSEKTPGPS
jgi:membrane protein involved in colicin uptake